MNTISKSVYQTRVRALLVSLFLLVLLGPLTASGKNTEKSSQMQATSPELEKDLADLDSFRVSRNLESLEAIVKRDVTKWQKRDRQSYLTYLFGVCSLLSSYDLGDQSQQALLLGRYAVLALSGGDLSLKEQIQFVEFLAQDPLKVDERTWKIVRMQKAEWWLKTWERVKSSIDPTFNFNDRPFLNIQPPLATGLPAGVSPESIKDPKLRAEYEAAIADNSAKAQRYSDQQYLKQNYERFFKEAERYLVFAYARSPKDLPELERLLNEFISDPIARKRVSEEVRKGE